MTEPGAKAMNSVYFYFPFKKCVFPPGGKIYHVCYFLWVPGLFSFRINCILTNDVGGCVKLSAGKF